MSILFALPRIASAGADILTENHRTGEITVRILHRTKPNQPVRRLLLAAMVLLLTLLPTFDGFALSSMGSRGDEVRRIQTALRDRGYLNDAVDGIFGSRTRAAVIRFQKDAGLQADGIAGPKTLAALGLSNAPTASDAEYRLLARLISAEARGEPYIGQVAVGAVVLNRVEHPSFPDSIAGVIYQNGAFSCLRDGQFDRPVADSAYQAARDALNGLDPSGGAIYYFNPATATSAWIWSRPCLTVIGCHRFCA